MNKNEEYWHDIANYESSVAKALMQMWKYLYVDLIWHQTVDNALKAIIANDNTDGQVPEEVQNLTKLVNAARMYEEMTAERSGFIDEIDS